MATAGPNSYFKTRTARALLAQAPTSVAAATGTATRTTFLTSSVTLPQLAERVMALLEDLKTAQVIK